MEKFDINTYNGNVRIDSVSRDVLKQLFAGDTDSYNDAYYPQYMAFVGKVGVLVDQWLNRSSNTRVVVVEFSTGGQFIFAEYDVSPTELPITPEEFIPEFGSANTSTFTALSESEKEFADLVYLTLVGAYVTANKSTSYIPQNILWETAIDSAQHREKYYSMLWEPVNG